MEHANSEVVGIHASRSANRFEALEPVRQGVHRCFGAIAPRVARGLKLRHDHGSNYMSGNGGLFQHLSLEDLAMFVVPDATWDQYGQDGDRERPAPAHAAFFRATFMPSLASALDCSGDAGAVRAFGDRLERGIRQSVANNPAPLEIKAQVILLAKR